MESGAGISTDIIVTRRVRDDLYVYTCDTLPGLFVVSHDDKIAYEDVPRSIRLLLKLDYDRDCVVTHKVTYTEFVEKLRLSERAREAVSRRTALLVDESDQIFFNIAQIASDDQPACKYDRNPSPKRSTDFRGT
jgi:hypothetical protein